MAGEAGIGFMRLETALAGANAGVFFVLPRFEVSLPITFLQAQSRTSDAVLTCCADALLENWDEHVLAPSEA